VLHLVIGSDWLLRIQLETGKQVLSRLPGAGYQRSIIASIEDKKTRESSQRVACTFVTRVTKKALPGPLHVTSAKKPLICDYHILPAASFSLFLQRTRPRHTAPLSLQLLAISSQLDRRTGRLLSNTSLCPQTSKSAQS
jgi:hypothetical protein